MPAHLSLEQLELELTRQNERIDQQRRLLEELGARAEFVFDASMIGEIEDALGSSSSSNNCAPPHAIRI